MSAMYASGSQCGCRQVPLIGGREILGGKKNIEKSILK